MALALYEATYIPLQLFFREPIDRDVGEFRMPIAQIVLQYLIDCCFWFDIYMRFNTTYISRAVEGNELVTDRQKIAQRYLRSDFSLDLMACTPCALRPTQSTTTAASLSESHRIRATRTHPGVFHPASVHAVDVFAAGVPEGGIQSFVAHCLRINRLLKCCRLWTVHAEEIGKLARLVRLVVFGGIFLLLTHWVACVWWGIGVSGLSSGGVNREGQVILPWLDRLPEVGDAMTQCVEPTFNGSGVFPSLPSAEACPRQYRVAMYDNASLAERYWTCMYWALTVMVKVAWLHPDSSVEKLYTGLCFLIVS